MKLSESTEHRPYSSRKRWGVILPQRTTRVNVSVLAAVFFVKTRGIPDALGVAFVNGYTIGGSTGRRLWTSKELDRCRASCRRGVEKASWRLRHVERRRRPFLRRLDPEDFLPIGQNNFKRNGYPWSNDWLNIAWEYLVSRSCVIGLHFHCHCS